MSYIVDKVGFEAHPTDSLEWQLQEYLNHKHEYSHPWVLVNVVSIEQLYDSAQDVAYARASGINVTIIWRTHL